MSVHLSPAVLLTIITGRLHCPLRELHKGLEAFAAALERDYGRSIGIVLPEDKS